MQEEKKLQQADIKEIRTSKSNLLNGTHIDFYGDDYSTELHPVKYYIHLFNEMCFVYNVQTTVNVEIMLKELNKKYDLTNDNILYKEEQANNNFIGKVDYSNSKYLIQLPEKILIEIFNYRVTILYQREKSLDDLTGIIKMIKTSKQRKRHNRKFYMVATSTHSEFGFDLQSFDVKKNKIKIDENYNDDFTPINELVKTFLKKDNNNGLLLLHGKYGTGKTTYIRHLISSINKRFIYLPLNLMDAISSPNFLPFISQYKDSILILEDCEELLIARSSGHSGNNSLANLLNLGDGLLSDALSIKIICTFNADLKQIDKAIMRKGRLIARYEFKPLSIEKAQQLFDSMETKTTATKPMTLAEIYNSETDDFAQSSKERSLGFGAK